MAQQPKQKSLLEVSDENHVRLVEYIERIHAAGLKLPGRQGKVNKTAIARACGFAREVFQQNPRFAATLEAAVGKFGIDVPEAQEPEPRNKEDRAKTLRLEQQLVALRSENHELRRRLRRYEAITEHMVGTGRRVTP